MEDFFWKNVQVDMTTKEFLSKFRNTQDFAQQIGLVEPFTVDWNVDSLETEFQGEWTGKSDPMSVEYCERMWDSCREENFKLALQECNKAIAYAATEEVLASAFAAKSTLLCRLKEMESALGEIEMALRIGSRQRRSSWEKVKVSYQKELEVEKSGEETQHKANWMEEKMRRKEFCKDLFSIKNPNPAAPALENFVTVQHNESRGRLLVVTKDVPIGQTLLVEKPFVSVLNKTLELESSHCHHCLQRNLSYVPCPNCVFALYCDQKCMEAAESYHKFECPCLPHLRSILLDHAKNPMQDTFDSVNFHMAFKLICILGPENLFLLYNLEEDKNSKRPVKGMENEIAGFDPQTGIYDSSSYITIANLSTKFSPEKAHYQLPLISLLLVKTLEAKSNFFENIDPTEIPSFRRFVGQRILEHYVSIRQNVMSIWEFNGDGLGKSRDKNVSVDYEVNLFSRGLYPTLGLCNHACDPNVMLFHDVRYGRIVIVAVRLLKKNEEVTIFYCPPFPDLNVVDRRQRLLSGYNFECTCVACLDLWPTLSDGLNSVIQKFCCSNCSAQLLHDLKLQKKMEGIILNEENKFKCPRCECQYEGKKIMEEFSKHKDGVTASLRLRLRNSPLEALDGLRLALQFFDNNIIPPYAFANFVQKFYIEALQCIIHLSD